MASVAPTINLADYLFTRLHQLGVRSVHGVPGDYNLALLDHVEPCGLRWVGNTNELNAAYAADGYSKTKGIAAIITTFGVGELSAINGIAGAYAERAPVVHIVGSPKRESQESRAKIHHTFNDGDYRRFAAMSAHVTVSQVHLWDFRTAATQIDEVLKECLLKSRPVYLEVPVDMIATLVPSVSLQSPIHLPGPLHLPTHENVQSQIPSRIYSTQQPIILVDGEIRPFGIIKDVQRLVELTHWPTWTTGFGKGLLDETLPNMHGVNRGKYGGPIETAFIAEADLVLCFGPHFSSTNTFGYSSVPTTDVRIGDSVFRDVPASSITSWLSQNLDTSRVRRYSPYPELPRPTVLSFSNLEGHKPITQHSLWLLLANIFRPGDIVLGETGTAGHGVRTMPLPKFTRAFVPVTWLSIGYMLPAAQGAALAQRELIEASTYNGNNAFRTVLFIGDGSFQMTVQELSTIIRHNLNVIVFVINNDGYTIERCIHGYTQSYNDIARWRYCEAPSFFGASSAFTAKVATWAELDSVLRNEELLDGDGLRLVEIVMDREDAPERSLLDMLKVQKAHG
ncbi:pyruvate decarboxylase [Fusarium oxysporum NRRL 32931]|uniref:Pyruvate decarboxylase n=1 Tax=Fusarium oxysporum NRRL 32931 TaxID=660029 RepID=W9HEI2_FUSOX|nr:pyruvate decarboxylase [Fusarium oxysporum NRRL 32931]